MHLVTVTWFSDSQLCMLTAWVTKEIKLPEDDFADSRRRFRRLDNLRSPILWLEISAVKLQHMYNFELVTMYPTSHIPTYKYNLQDLH